MAQTTATPKNGKAVSPKSSTANTPKGGEAQSATPESKPSTRRVVETRQQWAVVFDHTAALLALTLKGDAMPESPNEGFAFRRVVTGGGDAPLSVAEKTTLAVADQPHIRPYMHSLLAGFASRKALKHTKGTALEGRDLAEASRQVFLALHPKGDFDKTIGKAEPKQAKSLLEAVIAKL